MNTVIMFVGGIVIVLILVLIGLYIVFAIIRKFQLYSSSMIMRELETIETIVAIDYLIKILNKRKEELKSKKNSSIPI